MVSSLEMKFSLAEVEPPPIEVELFAEGPVEIPLLLFLVLLRWSWFGKELGCFGGLSSCIFLSYRGPPCLMEVECGMVFHFRWSCKKVVAFQYFLLLGLRSQPKLDDGSLLGSWSYKNLVKGLRSLQNLWV